MKGDSYQPPGEEDYELHTVKTSSHDDTETLMTKSEGKDDMYDVSWNGHSIRMYDANYKKYSMVGWQIAFSLIIFGIFGLNDQATGALMPTLLDHYGISMVTASNIFLIQLVGYLFASALNERVHRWFGVRGAMLAVCILCFIPYGILTIAPPSFYIYLFCMFPIGLGLGIADSGANVLIGNLTVNRNEWMGILHAVYGGTSMVTPPIASYFVKWNHWSIFFLIPTTAALINILIIPMAFPYETAMKYNYIATIGHEDDANLKDIDETNIFQVLKNPVVALYAAYMFLLLGGEITTGSWFLTYLLKTKSNKRIAMSYVSSSFWTGITVGRLCLGFVTHRFFKNEYTASNIYSWLSVLLYTIFVALGFSFFDNVFYFILMYITLFFAGFFIGPLSPNSSIVAIQNLPQKLHISGVGLAVAIGGCGGAALPYISGIIINNVGETIIPTLLWVMVLAFTLVWCLYPRYIPSLRQ
ncbi:Bypass of stop codon protein 6 [Nakaseomyces bracarensis]|uniref:Bypass of stop codon protein 6 n=1 Tax=Nakaseomyces bracarensis TaxID=273131 RepID=A0ABR4NT41_9SACH